MTMKGFFIYQHDIALCPLLFANCPLLFAFYQLLTPFSKNPPNL